ncbi:MAG: serine/threonine-protein kinase, partial [Planctomycetota bacterium]
MEELSPTARLPADVEAASQDASRRWGPYVILSELGRGANGVVNLAYDLRLHRKVALKTLLEMSPVQFERFAREARAAAKLEHAGIVRVLDLALLNGRPYMAMEVVEGRSLRSCFREQSLRTRELVSILRDVAEALGHAHGQGIVHRDVKPGNIFVDSTGRGKIMDFGVARDADGEEKLTTTGQTLGTPEYMSPEQASDPRSVSPQSDVYSVGAVLFEGLTG